MIIFLLLSLHIKLFESTIWLETDGSLYIIEEITVDFSSPYSLKNDKSYGFCRNFISVPADEIENNSRYFKIREVLMDEKEVSFKKEIISEEKEVIVGTEYLSPNFVIEAHQKKDYVHLRLQIGEPAVRNYGIHKYLIKYLVPFGVRYSNEWDKLSCWITESNYFVDSSQCKIIFPSPIWLSQKDIDINFISFNSRNLPYSLDESSLSFNSRKLPYSLDESSLSFATGIVRPTSLDIRFPKGYLTNPPFIKVFSIKLRNDSGILGFLFVILFPILFIAFIFFLNYWLKKKKNIQPGYHKDNIVSKDAFKEFFNGFEKDKELKTGEFKSAGKVGKTTKTQENNDSKVDF